MAVITAEQFKNKAVSIIPIPGFDEGETFEIKVKKLSLVGLMSSGKIPNSLMQVVKEAFAGIKSNTAENDAESSIMDKAGEIGKLLDIVCTEAMLEPKFCILDETDSGLDVDALRIVAEGFNKLRSAETSAMVITHYQRLLDYIVPDFVHVLYKGRIIYSGGKELALKLEKEGYDWLINDYKE